MECQIVWRSPHQRQVHLAAGEAEMTAIPMNMFIYLFGMVLLGGVKISMMMLGLQGKLMSFIEDELLHFSLYLL
jgi:hypothetical protein